MRCIVEEFIEMVRKLVARIDAKGIGAFRNFSTRDLRFARLWWKFMLEIARSVDIEEVEEELAEIEACLAKRWW